MRGLRLRAYTATQVLAMAPPAPLRQYKAHAPMPMDAERMYEEAQSLCGRHDFAAPLPAECRWRAPCARPPRAVERQGEDVVLTVLGDGFLYNMCASSRHADGGRHGARAGLHRARDCNRRPPDARADRAWLAG